jgi:hypothetical protein
MASALSLGAHDPQSLAPLSALDGLLRMEWALAASDVLIEIQAI